MTAFEKTYADTRLAPANKTPDGKMIERAEVLARQRAVIEDMAARGILH